LRQSPSVHWRMLAHYWRKLRMLRQWTVAPTPLGGGALSRAFSRIYTCAFFYGG
jgi:hypothetical protein